MESPNEDGATACVANTAVSNEVMSACGACTAPVGITIALLLVIVATSYRQTVMEYSSGGGAYVVSRDNLGTAPAYLAGAALLVDYVLTVAVSVASGVAAITSAWPAVHDHCVALAVICVVVMMLVHLRSMRESAHVFAVPVYGFIGLMLFLVAFGLARYATGNLSATTAVVTRVPVLESLTFSSSYALFHTAAQH